MVILYMYPVLCCHGDFVHVCIAMGHGDFYFLSKVLKLWSDVDAFIKSTKVEREILHDIVMPSHDYHVIDGKDLQYKVINS